MNMEDENYMLYLKQIFKIITIQSIKLIINAVQIYFDL